MFIFQGGDTCFGISALIVYGPYVDCSTTPDAREFYVRSAAAQASGLSRCQLQASKRRALEADVSLCPASLTACRVSGSEDGYEVRNLSLALTFNT